MRKENKIKKALILTEEDFKKDAEKKGLKSIYEMLRKNPVYEFYVKKALYEAKKLSYKGFLNNDDIYKLKLGRKNTNGDILISNHITGVFDRYLLSTEFFEKGDIVTSFMIDLNDTFYDFVKSEGKKDPEKTNFEYEMAYKTISNSVLAVTISDYLEEQERKKED